MAGYIGTAELNSIQRHFDEMAEEVKEILYKIF